ncbi:MAG: ABC transporter substrate-binding protein [Parvibaculaceae bacterium]
MSASIVEGGRRMVLGLAGLAICGLLAGTAVAGVSAPDRIKAAGKVVFCTELAYPPWEMLNAETQAPEGFDVDIAAALTKAMGVASEHKNISFDGLIPALQAGQCDAIISGLADKPERRETVDFVNYAVAGNAVITRADNPATFATLEDLSGLKVSVAVGSALEAELKKASDNLKSAGKPEINILSLQSGTDAFQQLTAGLADAYFGSTDQAGYFNKQKPGLLKLASPQLFSLTIGLATLKKDQDLHEAFAGALKELKSSGEYKKILADWGFEAMGIE